MSLRKIAEKLKRLEKKVGIPERERQIKSVISTVKYLEQHDPLFMQELYWNLVELTHEEIRDIGEGKRDLSDFADRFKIDLDTWFSKKGYLLAADREAIARFNAENGDPYPDWWLAQSGIKDEKTGELKAGSGME